MSFALAGFRVDSTHYDTLQRSRRARARGASQRARAARQRCRSCVLSGVSIYALCVQASQARHARRCAARRTDTALWDPERLGANLGGQVCILCAPGDDRVRIRKEEDDGVHRARGERQRVLVEAEDVDEAVRVWQAPVLVNDRLAKVVGCQAR